MADVDAATKQIARAAAREALNEIYDQLANRTYRPEPKYLTPEMAATYLQTTVDTLKQWRKEGRGPKAAITQHKFVRYTRADLDAWVESLAASPAGE